MAVELKRLIKKVSHMDITNIAGTQGLNNIVTWVHMVETSDASTFLEGGEIAFTTGIGLSNSLTILELVKNIWSQNASGMIINLGAFIETVPTEVINFCNEHNFPLFTVPWKIHLAEIMRIFCYSITKSEQEKQEISAAFKNAIFFPQHTELYLIPLSHYHFQSEWNYYVSIINITYEDHKIPTPHTLEALYMNLDNFMKHRQFERYAMFCYEDQIITILGNYEESYLDLFISTLEEHLKTIVMPTQDYQLSIGKCTKSIRCLHKSYRQAQAIQSLHQKDKIDKSLIAYSNMGVYKLLMGIEDKDILLEYYEKTIQPLEEYDKKNQSDLSLVLRNYLKHNGSVNQTAEELFVHRNTVNYKLNRAADIMKVDLSLLETRLQLLLGFMLQDML